MDIDLKLSLSKLNQRSTNKIAITIILSLSALISKGQENVETVLYVNDSLSTFKLVEKSLPKQFYLKGEVESYTDNEPIYSVKKVIINEDTSTLKSLAIENGIIFKGRHYFLNLADSLTYEYSGKINGYEIYEAIGYTNQVLMYSFCAQHNQDVIICSGLCYYNFEDTIEEFKNLSRTIKIK